MKRIIAFVATLVVSMAAFSAYAQEVPQQENVLFKHVSVGTGLGIGDGLQFQVATTILPNLQARILYTSMTPYIAIANGIVKNQAGIGIQPFQYKITGINYHDNGINVDEVTLEGSTRARSLSLLADFYPFKNSAFHLTGGIMFSLQKSLISGKGTPVNTSSAAPAMSDQDKGNVAFYGITTDWDGNALLDIQYGLPIVKPYVGIGFGRPCSIKHRVGVNFDMGVSYTGGVHAYSYNYQSGTPVKVELNKAWVEAPGNEDIKNNLGSSGEEMIKYLTAVNNLPIMPYLRFTVNVAIF